MFLENGVVEVNTEFEQNEFALERLYPGSVINQRAFFMQDNMYVNIKVSREAKILELSQDKFQEIRDRYDNQGFSTRILAFQNKILKKEQKFPLDYIMKIPETI